MESGYAYPERSGNKLAATCENVKAETCVRTKNDTMVLPEVSKVIVSRQRAVSR
jgi:hypothetical protein